MEEHYTDIEILIAKFLAGEASPDEAMLLHDWIDQSATNKKLFEATEAAWTLGSKHRKPDVQKTFESLALAKSKKQIWFSTLRIAAGILIILFFGYGLYNFYFTPTHQDGDGSVLKVSEQQSLKLKLTEGSVVTMNKRSLIRYSKSFSANREIYLAGEAYFEVTPNREKPFMVGTDDVMITVLGTAFNVSSYTADSLVQVQVVHGKVLMQHAVDSLMLTAGEKGLYNKITKKLWLEKPETHNNLAYATHTFTYTDRSLNRVLEDLSTAYGVTFEVETPMVKNCHLTGEYHSMELPVILEVISKSLDLTYRIEGNRVYISGDGCL